MENANVATQHQPSPISPSFPVTASSGNSSSTLSSNSLRAAASNPFTSSRWPHWDICQHKFLICCSLSHNKCCACLDDRQHAPAYPRYVDGIGEVNDAPRWDGYCTSCKTYWKSLVERCNINPQHSQVPNYPNPLPGGHNPAVASPDAFRLPPSPPSQTQPPPPRQLPYPHLAPSQDSQRRNPMQHEPLHRALAPTPEWANEYTRMRDLPSSFSVFSQMGFRLSSPPPQGLQMALQNWELADEQNLRSQPDGVTNMNASRTVHSVAAAREAVIRELQTNRIDVYLLLRPNVPPPSYPSMSQAFRNFSSWAAGTPIVERDSGNANRSRGNQPSQSGNASQQQTQPQQQQPPQPRPESWGHQPGRSSPGTRPLGNDAETSMIARDRQREVRERFESEMERSGRGNRSLRINPRATVESRAPISPISYSGFPQYNTFGWSPPNTAGLVASSNIAGQNRGFESGQDLSQPSSIVSTAGVEQQPVSRPNRSFSTPSAAVNNWSNRQQAAQASAAAAAAQVLSPTASTATTESANSPMSGVERATGSSGPQSPQSPDQPAQLQRSQSDQTPAQAPAPAQSSPQQAQRQQQQQQQQPQQPQQQLPQHPQMHHRHPSQGPGGASMVPGVLGSREEVEREDYESPITLMFANHWQEYNANEQRRRQYREMEERARRNIRQSREDYVRRNFHSLRQAQPRWSAGTRATSTVQAEQRRSYPSTTSHSLAIQNLARSLGQNFDDDLHQTPISPPLDPPSWEDDVSMDDHDTISFLRAVDDEAARRRAEGRGPTESGGNSPPSVAAAARSADIHAAQAEQARRQVRALEQLMGWTSDRSRHGAPPPIMTAPRLRPAQVYHSSSMATGTNGGPGVPTGAAATAAAAAVAGARPRASTLSAFSEEARRLHNHVEQQREQQVRQQRETAEFLRNEDIRRITDFASLLHSGVNIRRHAAQARMARAPAPARTLDDPERPENLNEEDMKIMSDCKVCFGQIADIVLLPCAHMVLCQWCADAVAPAHPARPDYVSPRSQCPVCRAKVEKKVKVFRA